MGSKVVALLAAAAVVVVWWYTVVSIILPEQKPPSLLEQVRAKREKNVSKETLILIERHVVVDVMKEYGWNNLVIFHVENVSFFEKEGFTVERDCWQAFYPGTGWQTACKDAWRVSVPDEPSE